MFNLTSLPILSGSNVYVTYNERLDSQSPVIPVIAVSNDN